MNNPLPLLEMVVAVMTICVTAGSIFKRAVKPLADSIEKLNNTLDKSEEKFNRHEKESAITLTNHGDRLTHLEHSHSELAHTVRQIKKE